LNDLFTNIATYVSANKWGQDIAEVEVKIENNILGIGLLLDNTADRDLAFNAAYFDESEERQPDKISAEINTAIIQGKNNVIAWDFDKNEIQEIFAFIIEVTPGPRIFGNASKIVSKNVIFGDLVGGGISIDIDFCTLAKDEYILNFLHENIDFFADMFPDPLNDLEVTLWDTTNNIEILRPDGFNLENLNPEAQGYIANANSLNDLIWYTYEKLIHSATPRQIKLRFTSASLAGLTAGESNFYAKIETLPAPIHI